MGHATKEQVEEHVRRQPNAARAWLVAERTARRGWITEADAAAWIGSPKPAPEALNAENAAWSAERDARRAGPPDGPGTELKAILSSWGYTMQPGCSCLGRMAQMNRWGSGGCRRNYWTVVGWLKDAAAADGGWLAWAADRMNLIPGVVTQAIDRAAAKGL